MNIIRQIIQKCGSIKSKTITEIFCLICVQMGSIEETPGTFYLGVVSCAISSTTNRQMRAEIVYVTIMKKLMNQSGSFEYIPKFN